MNLVVIYIVLALTLANAVFFLSALDRNLRTRRLIKGYLEDIKARGGKLPNYIPLPKRVTKLPTGLSRRIKLLQLKFRSTDNTKNREQK